MMDEIKVALSVAGNCGDRERNCRRALEWLQGILSDCRVSSIYETANKKGFGPDYMNAVAIGFTTEPFETLEAMLKDYEMKAGRTAEARARGDVPIDIDIVEWNGTILKQGDIDAGFLDRGFREASGQVQRRESSTC